MHLLPPENAILSADYIALEEPLRLSFNSQMILVERFRKIGVMAGRVACTRKFK